MLNLHRDKNAVKREPGRDGKTLSDHRQDRSGIGSLLIARRGPSAISEMQVNKQKPAVGQDYFFSPNLAHQRSEKNLV